MSDYLDRLVERSLGLAEPVQPRPVSLYESPEPSPDPRQDESVAGPTFSSVEAPTLREILRQPEPDSTPSPRRRAEPIIPTVPAIPAAHDTRSIDASPPAEPHPMLDPAPAPATAPPVLSRRSAEVAGAREAQRTPASTDHTTVVHHVEREALRPASIDPHPPLLAVPQLPAREHTIERVTVVERPSGDERNATPSLQPLIADRPERQRMEVLQPIPAPREPHRPVPLSIPSVDRRTEREPSPAQAEPVIHVTIGRLEIRATTPQTPAAPRRTREQPAVMSLDDYLRQRAGGSKP